MSRKRLPDRRQAETVVLHYGGQRYHLTIGEYLKEKPDVNHCVGGCPLLARNGHKD